MRASEAVDLINNRLTFRPEWTIRAEEADNMLAYASLFGSLGDVSGRVAVEFTVRGFDTSYPDRYGRYTRPLEINPIRVVDVTSMNEEELCAWIITIIKVITQHEDSEYLRVRQPDGSWKAPFHPHRIERRRNWDLARLHPEVRSVEADIEGLARAGAE